MYETPAILLFADFPDLRLQQLREFEVAGVADFVVGFTSCLAKTARGLQEFARVTRSKRG